MKWDELVEKQSKEYAEHIESVKQSKEQLHADKEAILTAAKCKEAELPSALKDKLQRDVEAWEKEYGMYGSRFKEMRISHQKDLNKFFERDGIAQKLSKDTEKSKDKSAGR
jgi:hypothetical protein